MTAEAKSCRKKWKIAVSILLAVLILLAGGFFWYVSDYYQAEDVALEVLASGDHLEVRDDLTILSLSYPTDTAIIFYPGAKVEAAAYLPLLNQLRQTGLTCILVEMPFHLAIFDVNAAEDVMAQFPDIQHWYIAGHSMGGPWPPSSLRSTRTRWTACFCWEPISTATIRLPIPSPSMAP